MSLPLRLHPLDCICKKPLVKPHFHRKSDILLGGYVLPKKGIRYRSVSIGWSKPRVEPYGLIQILDSTLGLAQVKVGIAPAVVGQGKLWIEPYGLI